MPTSLHDVRRDAFNYVWDRSIPPALEVRSGDEGLLHARDASDEQLHQGATATDVATLDFAHVNPVSGPVFVAGAAPGDTLEVEILELVPQRWGWTAIIPGFGLLADEYPDPWLRISEVDAEHGVVRFSNEVEVALRAFPGTIGVAPAEPGPHSVIPPSRWGGNLDTRHLVAGATLLLPIGVEGALFSLGDTHAAQGDGEVCGTAVECAMDVTVRLSVRTDVNVTAPQLQVPVLDAADHSGYRICTGVGPDLHEAARDAVRSLVDWLGDERGLDREEAYAVASVACDLRIHEVVDAPNWVVGACLPLGIFV